MGWVVGGRGRVGWRGGCRGEGEMGRAGRDGEGRLGQTTLHKINAFAK